MAERLLWICALIVAATVGVMAIRIWVSRRNATLRSSDPGRLWSALGDRPDGRPTLVVFSTPSCVACRASQQPAVERLSDRLGVALRLIHVDISAQPVPARAFKVLTAPSTAVLRADGRLHQLNHGFAAADELDRQIKAAAAPQAFWP